MTSDQRAIALVTPDCTTTSLIVAEVFGKRHDDVLRAIRALIEQAPELVSEHARKFAGMTVNIEVGQGAIRQSPAYTITRDGFMLLAMGFTGKKALNWKLAFIEAFNEMEAALRSQSAQPAAPAIDQRAQEQAERKRFNQIAYWTRQLAYAHKRLTELGSAEAAQGMVTIGAPSPTDILTDAQADALRDRVVQFVRKVHGYGAKKSDYGRAFGGLCAAFGVTRYYRIPQDQFQAAMDAVAHAAEWKAFAIEGKPLIAQADKPEL